NVAYILNDSGARAILVDGPDQLAKLAEVADRLPNVQRIVSVKPFAAGAREGVTQLDFWLPKETPAKPPAKTDGHTLATIVYTSGTTGKPKGVMLSHRNML